MSTPPVPQTLSPLPRPRPRPRVPALRLAATIVMAFGCVAAAGLVLEPAIASGGVTAHSAGAAGTPFIAAVAGTGAPCGLPPSCGDGGLATRAQLNFPEGVAVGPGGELYIADWGDNEVRRIAPSGQITTVAGDGVMCTVPASCGDGGPATSAELADPSGIAVDAAGTLYIADTFDDEVRKVTPNGKISRVAGNGSECTKPASCGDGGTATAAALNSPEGVALDRAGNLYIADTGDNEVREVLHSGAILTLAGNGQECTTASQCGDGGSAVAARLSSPAAVAVGPRGRLYIADDGDNEIRTVFHTQISTLAGTGALCAAPPACGD